MASALLHGKVTERAEGLVVAAAEAHWASSSDLADAIEQLAIEAMVLAGNLAGLLGLGLATARFNGRGRIYSGLRQVLIGAAAAAVTFGVGRLFGTALS